MKVDDANAVQLAPPYTFDPNFPYSIRNEVRRKHVIETLKEEVDESDVVFIEGQQGSGATILLSQFCRQIDGLTFSLFLRPSSRFAYDPSFVRSMLADQIEYYLDGKRAQREAIDASEFHLLVIRLRRAVRDRPVYFVVDGLHQIPSEDRVFADRIMREVLPVGIGGFRFLISGASTTLAENLRGQSYGTFRVPKLSDTEARAMLAASDLEAREEEDILRAARGNPGRLASVSRLLATGVAAEDILSMKGDQYLDFIKLEFERAGAFSEVEAECIAAVAFAKHLITKNDLAAVLAISAAHVELLKEKFPVLIEDEAGVLGFASEAHRRYAERKFERLRSKVVERQIAHLRSNPDTSQALQYLPAYYQMLNSQAAIVELLKAPEHYVKLLATTQSMSALRARAMMGARSASELREALAVFQFALQQGIFASMASGRSHRAEVRALVALGEPQRALDVASTAASNESRLFLLAEYARGMRERGEVLDPDVVAYIRSLFSTFDAGELGSDIHRLAENLLFVDADLALSLFDKYETDGSASRDTAIARLAVVSMTSRVDDREIIGEKARQRIHNESLQKILGSLKSIVADSPLSEVKSLARTLEGGRRISFLRSIALSPSPKLDIPGLVEYALDEIVRDAAYRPSMRDFLDLAQPLSRLGGGDRERTLLKRLEGQIRVIEKAASSKDLVLIDLCVARADASVNISESVARLRSALDRIGAADELEVRVDCLATFLEVVYSADAPWGAIDEVNTLKVAAQASLIGGIHLLLDGAADHFGVVESALTSIAKYDPRAAIEIASGLNMATRRDDAIALISKEVSRKSPIDEALLKDCISRIVDSSVKDRVLAEIVSLQDSLKDSIELLRVLSWAQAEIDDPLLAAKTSVHLLEMCVVADLAAEVAEIETSLHQQISRVDSVVHRVDLFYSASAVLAKSSVKQSIIYFEAATELKRQNAFGSEASFDLMRMCLTLLLRVMRSVLQVDAQADAFLRRYVRLVGLLPCRSAQAAFLSELSIKAWAEGKGDLCRKIVTENLRPLLDTVEPEDPLHRKISATIFPAVFLGHRASSDAVIAELSTEDRAWAVHSTAMAVLRKTSPSESWTGEDRELRVAYEDLQDVLALLELAPTDHSFYSTLTTLSKAVGGKHGRRRLTAQQRSDAVGRVLEMIDKKLPDPENIQHRGYVIVSTARALAMLDRAEDAKWRELVKEGRAVSNVADRQYILIEIADSLPTRSSQLRRDLMCEAYNLIKSIPAILDRLGRLENYISAVRIFDTVAAKSALREAMSLTFEVEKDEYVSNARRNLIDVAELIEPGFAEKVAEAIEDDPAREEAKAEISRAAALQKFKRQVSSTKAEKDREELNRRNLPSAAWKNVSSLISARLEPLQPERMLEYLSAASSFGFEDAFPVLAWYIENASRRYTTRGDVELRVLPLAEVMFLSAELAADMLQDSTSGGSVRFRVVQEQDAGGVVLGPHDRAAATNYIRGWLRTDVRDQVVLCDPYFSIGDLGFLRLVLLECPEASVVILTSRQKFGRVNDEDIQREWRAILDQDPPVTEIVVVSDVGDERSPVHDRWLLSDTSGLRLGTSFSSLGIGRITEISVVEKARVPSLVDALRPFIDRQRVVNGRRVQYSTVSL